MDLFRPDEMKRLMGRIVSLTNEGALGWAAGDRPSSFKASLPRFHVRVWSIDSDDLPPFGFEILSKATGERLGSATSQDDVEYSAPLEALFQTAGRSALNLDEIVSQLEEDLDSLEPPPF